MKCENCLAYHRGYEIDDEYCMIRDFEQLKTGCHLSLKTIRRELDKNRKAQIEEYARMAEFFEKEGIYE